MLQSNLFAPAGTQIYNKYLSEHKRRITGTTGSHVFRAAQEVWWYRDQEFQNHTDRLSFKDSAEGIGLHLRWTKCLCPQAVFPSLKTCKLRSCVYYFWRRRDGKTGEDVKLLLSSEKSIEHEGEIEYSKPSGHSDKLEKCLSRAKVQHPRLRALIARTSGKVIDEAAWKQRFLFTMADLFADVDPPPPPETSHTGSESHGPNPPTAQQQDQGH